jgi:hypothetical protein
MCCIEEVRGIRGLNTGQQPSNELAGELAVPLGVDEMNLEKRQVEEVGTERRML